MSLQIPWRAVRFKKLKLRIVDNIKCGRGYKLPKTLKHHRTISSVCHSNERPYQVADAVIGVVRYRERNAELGQPNEKGANRQRVDQVQVVGIISW